VKQGDSLAPVLFRFTIQAAAESMNKNWQFRKPDLFVSSKNYMSKRDDAKDVKTLWTSSGPSTQKMLR
jgi:hypothetical protein